MGLSPAQAKLLLERNALNLADKVKGGKPLAPKEVAMLEAIIAGAEAGTAATTAKTYAKSQQELADALGLKDRKTIQRWLKESPNPGTQDDGRYDVTAWREFARNKGHDFDDEGNPSQAEAKAEQILLQNERLRHRIAEEKGLLIPTAVAKETFAKLLMSLKGRSYSGITRLVTLARMAPNSAEAAEEIRKELDAIWQSAEDSKWLK